MKKRKIALNGLMLFFLLCICAGSWPAEDRIVSLQDQISALKEQKAQLEAEKQKLMAEGDELSSKIEDLKMQARGGLGIIGRFRLSRSLRKAQALSEKVYALEKKINEIDGELNDKRNELEGEYERQIAALLEKLSQVEQTSDSSLLAGAREERREILEKVKEYQIAKEQLAEPEKKFDSSLLAGARLERLDITKIEIKEYDGPQEIREKADLINDFANKLRNRVDSLNARVGKLQEELKTRERLGEFAEEISFFGERISREEITSDAGKPDVVTSAEEPGERRPVTPGTDTIPKDEGAEMLTEAEPLPERTETLTSTAPDRIVVERNGVSADFVGISLDQIKREIEMLKSQEQALRKELVVLSEKASSFYKKADEIEKSEIEKGEEKR